MRVVGLLLLACVVASFADESTSGKPVSLSEGEAKAKACTLYDPAAMAKIESDAAAAATLKKTSAIAAATKECDSAKARASHLKDIVLKAATAEKTASDLAAGKVRDHRVAKAQAEVAANKTRVMTQINFERQDKMARATRETKREMDDISRIFKHKNIVYKTTADHSVATAKDAAHVTFQGKITSQLAATKQSFTDATAAHQKMRTDIITKYNTDKALALANAKAKANEIRKQAAKKHLADVRLAKAMQTRKVEKATKIAAAANAAAEAKKTKDLADAENDSKVAQMGSWVTSMEAQFDRAADKYCEY